MKRIAKIFVAGIIIPLFVQVGWNLYNNRSIFDISSWTEKCIFCNFENRHHCHLCASEHRRCLFCDHFVTNQANKNHE